MSEEQPFIDYYALLGIDPACSPRDLEAAYHHWAKMYHPDHPATADVDRFNEVVQAYRALRNPEERAQYDQIHAVRTNRTAWSAVPGGDPGSDQDPALDDAEAQARILMLLYRRRRENALDAGVSDFMIQELLACSHEVFEFHRWYLKAKGWIETTEQGTLAITIEGIDHVMATSRTAKVEKLLIAQSRERDQPRPR